MPEGQSRPFEVFYGIGEKTKRETKQLLPHRGEKLRAFVSLASVPGGASVFTIQDDDTLSVMLTDTFESWSVRAADVKVTCVPKESEFMKEHYGWLPEIDWEPE